MILVAAFLAVGVAALFMLWPLIRHLEPPTAAGSSTHDQDREGALLAIEEIELDVASGRLSSAQAEVRHTEARLRAERILNEEAKMASDQAEDRR